MAMKKETQNALLSFFYLLCLYLAVQLLPLSRWIPIHWVVTLVKIALEALLILLSIHEIRKGKMIWPKERISFLFSLPFLLVCVSNLLYAWIFRLPLERGGTEDFLLQTIEYLFSTTLEEMIFRIVLIYCFLLIFEKKKEKKELSLLLSALCFSLMHAINFFGNDPLSVLMQMGYTFYLGVLLGFFALYMDTYLLPSFAHFLFNFLNNTLFSYLFPGVEITLSYVLFSVGIGVLVLLYFIFVYILKVKKKEHVSQTRSD